MLLIKQKKREIRISVFDYGLYFDVYPSVIVSEVEFQTHRFVEQLGFDLKLSRWVVHLD